MSLKMKYKTLGLYKNAFFSIEIANKDIDLNNLANISNDCPDKLGVLFHEYIHYIQDISTTYGLMSIVYKLVRLSGFIHYTYTALENNIQLPISLEYIKDAELSWDILSNVRGDCDCWTYERYQDVEIIDIKFEYLNNPDVSLSALHGDKRLTTFEIPTLKLKLTKNGNIFYKDFDFGAMAILESMANLIENHIYPNIKNGYDLIYDIAECLCSKMLPEFAKCKKRVVALCDASLMYENPGLTFYSSLFFMNKFNHICDTVESVYDFVYKSIKPDCFIEYHKNLQESITQLNNLLPKNNPYFNKINVFITNAINKAVQTRTNDKLFLCKIMSIDRLKAMGHIFSLMKSLEIPLIILEQKEIFSTFDNTDLLNACDCSYWSALYSLFLIFLQAEKKCDSISVCKFYKPDRVDIRCYENPLDRVSDEELCPLAAIWHVWQLSEKRLVT